MNEELSALARECGGIRSGTFDTVKQWTFTQEGLEAFAARVRGDLAGGVAYHLTKRLVIDMPTARAAVDEALRNAGVAACQKTEGENRG